jgi:RNA polymerase sigma-70 factor (ECF subfamily)
MPTRKETRARTPPSLPDRLKQWDDHKSWVDFNDTYWKLLYNAGVSSGLNDAEAKDAVQETTLTVAKSIGNFQYDPKMGSFQGWLMKIHRCRIVDQFRKRPTARGQTRVHLSRETDTDGPPTVERLPEPSIRSFEQFWDVHCAAAIQDAALQQVKRKVSPKQFQIFDLYVIKEWPVEQITARLRVSPGQVYLAKNRISKLMDQEVQRLWKEGY